MIVLDDHHDEFVLANSSAYGLGGSVFRTDTARAEAVAQRLTAGMANVNTPAGEGPDTPFGGIKRSGFGRELGAPGIDEFVNKQNLCRRRKLICHLYRVPLLVKHLQDPAEIPVLTACSRELGCRKNDCGIVGLRSSVGGNDSPATSLKRKRSVAVPPLPPRRRGRPRSTRFGPHQS